MSGVVEYIIVPWLLNALVLMWLMCSKESGQRSFWTACFGFWVVVLGLTWIPGVSYTGSSRNSIESVKWVIEKTWDKVFDALVHILRYIIPFAVYPIIIFWLKIWVHHTQNTQEQAWWAQLLNTRNIKQQRQQAQLITFVLKVLILVFVFFDLLGKLDIQTDRVLQIGTVFSLGLSWSMRDWLSSLWASFMISFTTELTCDSILIMGTNSAGASVNDMLRCIRPGLIYTVCTREVENKGDLTEKQLAQVRSMGRTDQWYKGEKKLVYIPNSALVSQGFVILHKPTEDSLKDSKEDTSLTDF